MGRKIKPDSGAREDFRVYKEMKKVYCQGYTNNRHISCWYGKPPKGIFKGDVIRLHICMGDDLWITPDEASTMIRALSAGLSHYLVENDKLAKLKK